MAGMQEVYLSLLKEGWGVGFERVQGAAVRVR